MDLENLDSDPMLRQVDIPLAEFSSLNQPDVFDGSLTDNMIPAGFDAPRKSGCIGDSGGPLVMSEESRIDSFIEVWVQVGGSNWGRDCGKVIPILCSHACPSFEAGYSM